MYIKAVILAGDLGARLFEEATFRLKKMLGNLPILWHIMKICTAHGLIDFTCCLGYKGYMIKEYFVKYCRHNTNVSSTLPQTIMTVHQERSWPWKITLIDTGKMAGIGGRLG